MDREGEDMVIWMKPMNETCSIKALYSILESTRSISFPMRVIWNSLVHIKQVFLLRKRMGKNIDVRSILDERMVIGKQIFFVKMRKNPFITSSFMMPKQGTFMVVVFFVWCVLGDIFHSQRDARMIWLLCGEKMNENVVSSFLMHFFG